MVKKIQAEGYSQRQLRVGEELRHALSEVLSGGKMYHPDLENLFGITVTEVRISPDLRNATAFVVSFGDAGGSFVDTLNDISYIVRKEVTSRVKLKYSPKIIFRQDLGYEKASGIDAIIANISREKSESVTIEMHEE
jgi:ribosome-binding factor A